MKQNNVKKTICFSMVMGLIVCVSLVFACCKPAPGDKIKNTNEPPKVTESILPRDEVTASPFVTATATAEITAEPSDTHVPTNTPEVTATVMPTATPKVTQAPKITATPKVTATPKITPVVTAVPKITSTPCYTATPTIVPTFVPTSSPVLTVVPTAEPTPSVIPTLVPTLEPTSTITPTAEPTPTPTPEPSEEPTEAPTQEPTAEPSDTPTIEPTPSPTPTPVPTATPMAQLPEYRTYEYGRSCLSEEDKIYYDDIKNGMLNYQENIAISIPAGGTLACDDESVERLKIIGEYVLADHPEIFWYNNVIGFQGYGSHLTQYSRHFITGFTTENVPLYAGKIQEKALKILNQYVNLTDEYEITKALFEYVTTHAVYDSTETYQHSVYGLLLNGKAVCDGYTKTFQYLLNYCHIDNIFVWGYSTGGSHAWCLVKNNGNWYQNDITWSDNSNPITGIPSLAVNQFYCTFSYFNLTDDEMYAREHTPAYKENIKESDAKTVVPLYILPECRSTDDNYFVKEKLCFDKYDNLLISATIIGEISSEDLESGNLIMIGVKFTSDEAWSDFTDTTSGFKITRAMQNASINYTKITYITYSEVRERIYIIYI